MIDYALAPSPRGNALTRQSASRLHAIEHATHAAITELSGLHRHAVHVATAALAEAEGIQLEAGGSIQDIEFLIATHGYLSQLTVMTETAGVDLLHLLREEYRRW